MTDATGSSGSNPFVQSEFLHVSQEVAASMQVLSTGSEGLSSTSGHNYERTQFILMRKRVRKCSWLSHLRAMIFCRG